MCCEMSAVRGLSWVCFEMSAVRGLSWVWCVVKCQRWEGLVCGA